MELLIIVLNLEEYFEKVVSLLVESGIPGATILDSEGLGHFLAYEVPIFAALREVTGEARSASRTILAVVERGFLAKFQKLLAEEKIDFTRPGMGIIVTLPVNDVIGPERE